MWATGVDRFGKVTGWTPDESRAEEFDPTILAMLDEPGATVVTADGFEFLKVGFEFVAVPPETTEEHVLGSAEEKQEPEQGRQPRRGRRHKAQAE